MKKTIKKGAVVVSTSIMLLSLAPNVSHAMDFGTTNFPMAQSTNTFNTMSSNNFAMDSLSQQQQMNALSQNQQQQSDKNKVSAVGYITKQEDKFYLDTNGTKHEILTQKGDILAVMPLLVDKEILVEFVGQYNSQTKQISAETLNLLKTPSDELSDQIKEALEEYKADQDVSGKGYIAEDEGKYKLRVNNKLYTILTDSSDIEVILPIISEEDIMVELIGKLDSEALTFTAKRMNFLDKPSTEKTEAINSALLANKDGKEVNATGYIKTVEGGGYSVKIQGVNYTLVLSDEQIDIQKVVPIIANKELLINVVGKISIADKKIEVTKFDIVDTPSPNLQAEIAKAIEGYEEGNGTATGHIISKDGDMYLKVEPKDADGEPTGVVREYKITAEKEDLKTFLEVVKDEEALVSLSGFVSNKNKTVKAEKALLSSAISSELKSELATAMAPHIKLPDNGSTVDVKGKVIKKGSDYYVEVSFSDYKITSERNDLNQTLPLIADTGLAVALTGKIDTVNKGLKADRLSILETPSKELKEKIDAVIASGKNSSGTTGSNGSTTGQNNPFGNFPNFGNMSNFPSFQGLTGNSNTGGTTNGTTANNPFANFDFSKFSGFSNSGNNGDAMSSLFSNLANMQMPSTSGQTSGQGSNGMSSLFSSFFGNTGANSTTSLFNNQQMANMPSLSFNQIQQVLNGMGQTPSTGSQTSSNTSGSSSSSSGSNGFAEGEPNGTSGFSVDSGE